MENVHICIFFFFLLRGRETDVFCEGKGRRWGERHVMDDFGAFGGISKVMNDRELCGRRSHEARGVRGAAHGEWH